LLVDLKITQYLEKAAAGTAVPGGGSVAALNAALAAGLTAMVARLTIGKKGYETAERDMQAIADQASLLRQKLTAAIDADADAYSRVMAAFKLPRDSAEQKALRSREIQQATKQAARVPLEVARRALAVLELAGRAVKQGNKNAASDGAVAAMNARTAVLAAIFNVRINLAAIKDDEFTAELSREINRLETQTREKETEILSAVTALML
jgi:formiminotetrahydrofolate cyclodeaminase